MLTGYTAIYMSWPGPFDLILDLLIVASDHNLTDPEKEAQSILTDIGAFDRNSNATLVAGNFKLTATQTKLWTMLVSSESDS